MCCGATASRQRPRTTFTRRCMWPGGRSTGTRSWYGRNCSISPRTSTSIGWWSALPLPGGRRTPAAYRAALSLYGGELLPENRYDDWAEARRDELTELAEELADGAA